MPATVAPDVQNPAFLAECLFAAIADDNRLVIIAYLAHFAVSYSDHT